MRLLWLAEDCRRAGLKVVEVPGWETRGAEFPIIPNTVLAHHTATSAKAPGDLPSKQLLIDGRPDLTGPLCQVALGRNGTVYIVASGKAQHAGKGAWRGETSSSRTIGVEAEHDGLGPWPRVQYDAYVLLAATLLRGLGQGAERVCGHREWALPHGRKVDPKFDMDLFRREVAAWLEPHDEGDEMTPADIEAVAQRVAELLKPAIKATEDRLHADHVVILRGTASGTHPNNLTSIGKAVGVKQ